MITDKPEFLKVAEILTKSNVSEENCVYITNLIINTVKDRQNLIKYLEDKIENEKKVQKFLYENKNTKLVEKATVNSTIRTYKDVIERIKSGKYDD